MKQAVQKLGATSWRKALSRAASASNLSFELNTLPTNKPFVPASTKPSYFENNRPLQNISLFSQTRNFTTNQSDSLENTSTDLLYSRIPEDMVYEMQEALGTSDLRKITTMTTNADRSLYHSCLNRIQTRVKIKGCGEIERGNQIADMADKMYEDLHSPYIQALDTKQDKLENKKQRANGFVDGMVLSQKDTPWDIEKFQEQWAISPEDDRFKRKAVDYFETTNEQIARGNYTPKDNWDAEKMTRQLLETNIEYKHYRKEGLKLADQWIEKNISKDSKLTFYNASERKAILVCGGMGSGKSLLSSQFKYDEDMINQNADDLKTALKRSAVREGKIAPDSGLETVQRESSNCLHEARLSRCYDVKATGKAPHVMINSICSNRAEIEEFINGGRHIEVHHMSIPPEQAIKDNHERAKKIGRKPSDDAVRKSYELSAKSLLQLADYHGQNVTAHMYERNEGLSVSHIASIDCKEQAMHIHDMDGFKRVMGSSGIRDTKNESANAAIELFTEKGFDIRHRMMAQGHSNSTGRAR